MALAFAKMVDVMQCGWQVITRAAIVTAVL